MPPKDLPGHFRVTSVIYEESRPQQGDQRLPSTKSKRLYTTTTLNFGKNLAPAALLTRQDNVAPDLMEGSGIKKTSFQGIIQNQLLFEGFGIMTSSGDGSKKKLILNPKFGYICLMLAKKSNAETAC